MRPYVNLLANYRQFPSPLNEVMGTPHQACRTVALLERFLVWVPIVPFNLSAAKEFGLIEGELKRLGKPTGKLDAMIAAIARNLGAIVVTHNCRHFENIPHLQLEDWLIP